MEWRDEGVVLSVRKHGESSAIVSLLTSTQGRHGGLVRGGAGRRFGGVLQVGNQVAAGWRARLADHLGHFQIELVRARAALVLDEPPQLAALTAACAVVERAVPEREAAPELYRRFIALLDAIVDPTRDWAAAYVRWEVELLAELGFALDLTRSAMSGAAHDLAFVSPRTGRAVTAEEGRPYRERLLALPAFLTDPTAPASPSEIAAGLVLSGHFLESHVLAHGAKSLPAARLRLLDFFTR